MHAISKKVNVSLVAMAFGLAWVATPVLAAGVRNGGGGHRGGGSFHSGGGGGHGGGGGRWAGGGGSRWHRGGGGGWGGVGLGVGVGVLGGAILGSQYPYDNSGAGYYDYPQYEVGVDPSYCANTYRSYDPSSGTYLGYDGYRHPCP